MVGEDTVSGGKPTASANRRLAARSCDMNDTSNHALQNPRHRVLTATWHALLTLASAPLWDRVVPAPPPLRVHPGKDPSSLRPDDAAIRPVLTRYAAVLQVPMSLHTARNRYSPPAGADAVHVHNFALPTPPTVFGAWPRVRLVDLPLAHGIPLKSGVHRALAPGTQLGRGSPILDGDGHVVGEHLGGNLYCLFDLLGQQPAWVPMLLRRHLDCGVPCLLPRLAAERGLSAERVRDGLRHLREETETLMRACRATLRQASREAYVLACREGVAEDLRLLHSEITFLEDGVEEMARRVTADTRRLREGDLRLRTLRGRADGGEGGGRELERLQAVPGVCQASVQDGRISLTTAPILVEHAGRPYRLGRFQVDLHFNGDVRMRNLTNRLGPYDHPHIHQGRPCLGSIREGVAKLLGEFQFVAAAEVLVDFLHTVNPADWRLAVSQWPEAAREADRGVHATT